MSDDRAEISLFDIVIWLWSYRWLALACTALALGWTGLMWQNVKAPTPSYEVKLQIFSGGTPVRARDEIADIFAAGLSRPGLNLLSSPSTNPVILQTTDSQLANRVEADVEQLVHALMAEVRAQEAELKRLLPVNENALPIYLKTKAFVEGVNSGLIPPVVTTVSLAAVSQRSSQIALIIPVIVSGFLFLLMAGAVTFSREWKKRQV